MLRTIKAVSSLGSYSVLEDVYHNLFILSIPERPLSEQSLVHFPFGNIPLLEAHALGGWLFSFWGKENKTSMNSKDLVSLIVLHYPESKGFNDHLH